MIACSGTRVRPHVRKRRLHPFRLARGRARHRPRRAPARRKRQRSRGASAGGVGPSRDKFVENVARFRRAAELQQGQRLLKAPVAQGVGVGRRLGAVEQRQRLGRALLLQEVGRRD